MTAYILRVEGVDFDATVDDTHNLSAYRGGSLALLAAPCAVREFLQSRGVLDSEIFIGASQGAWIVKVADESAATMLREETEAFLRAGGDKGPSAVFPHLSFVVDVATGGDYPALKQAEAHNRARQLRHSNWALPEFVESAKGPNNKLDRMRPAPPACRVHAKGANDNPVSPSFKTRFEVRARSAPEFLSRGSRRNGGARIGFRPILRGHRRRSAQGHRHFAQRQDRSVLCRRQQIRQSPRKSELNRGHPDLLELSARTAA